VRNPCIRPVDGGEKPAFLPAGGGGLQGVCEMKRALILSLAILLLIPTVSAYTMSSTDHNWEVYDEQGNVVLSGVTPFKITKTDVDNEYALICTDTGWCKIYYIPDGSIVMRAKSIDLRYPYVVKIIGNMQFNLCTLDDKECKIHKEAVKNFILQLIVDYTKTKDPKIKQPILGLIVIYLTLPAF